MTSRVWVNPGPWPHKFEWVITSNQEFDTAVHFKYRCRSCHRAFTGYSIDWIGPGPSFVDVLKHLSREQAKVTDELCEGVA